MLIQSDDPQKYLLIGGPDDEQEGLFYNSDGSIPEFIHGVSRANMTFLVWQTAIYKRAENGEYHFTGKYKEEPMLEV